MSHGCSASAAGLISCDIRQYMIRSPIGSHIASSKPTNALSDHSNIESAVPISLDQIISSSVVTTTVAGASSQAKVFKRNTVINSDSTEEEVESVSKVPPKKRALLQKVSKKKSQSQSRSKRQAKTKSKYIEEEVECDSDFVDDGSCDESNSDAREMWRSEVQNAAAAMRNRRAFADDANMCPLCKQIRAIFIHILGLSM